jgi:hypothetical protein
MEELDIEVISARAYDYSANNGKKGTKVLVKLLKQDNPNVVGFNTKIIDIPNDISIYADICYRMADDMHPPIMGKLIYLLDYVTERLVFNSLKLD